jgi:hypothetical protein
VQEPEAKDDLQNLLEGRGARLVGVRSANQSAIYITSSLLYTTELAR